MILSPTKNTILNTIKSNKVVERRTVLTSHDEVNAAHAAGNKSSSHQQLTINTSISKYHNRASPPFRVGGRGSKQLTKVLQQTEEIADDSDYESCTNTNWMLCTSSPICFAKVVSISSHDKTMIQPLKLNPLDSTLLVPWDGHVWLAKNENLIPVKVLHAISMMIFVVYELILS
jgi:hypothetical protein